MIYPASCPRCGGATEYRADVPAVSAGIAYAADELVCLNCGFRRERVGPVSTHGVVPDRPRNVPKYWQPQNPHGGGPPRNRWHRYYTR